jgi:hypothetical protein
VGDLLLELRLRSLDHLDLRSLCFAVAGRRASRLDAA